MTGDEPTLREQFLYTVSREFGPDDAVFTGFHWPTVAAQVARRLHAPEVTTVYEAGIVNRGPTDGMPTSTTEVERFARHAEQFSESLDPLQSYLKSGRLDGAVVEAATVDRFGNVNSTAVGGYDDPTVRLPGPGGANDILAYGTDVTLVNGSLDTRRYRDRVTYVSSPGYLDGDGSRERAGYPPESGPETLLCPLGRFRFDETGRARLDALVEGVTVGRVRDVTGWDVESGDYDTLPVPDAEALAVVREEMRRARDRGYTAIRP